MKFNLLNSIAITSILFATNAFAEEIKVDVANYPVPLVMKAPNGSKASFQNSNLKEGDIVLKLPVAYRRTAVLKTDISAKPWFTQKTYVKAGAVGYWAGHFTSQLVTTSNYGGSSYGPSTQVEIWCFFGKDGKDKDGNVCILDSERSTALLDTYYPPYLMKHFRTSASPIELVRPTFEEKDLEIGKDLQFEYHIKKIKKNFVLLTIEVDGKEIERETLNFDEKGDGNFDSPIGLLTFKVNDDKTNVIFNYDSSKIQNTDTQKQASDEYVLNILSKIADGITERAKILETRENFVVNFIDKPKPQEQITNFKRYSLINQQSYIPNRSFIQENAPLNRPERFGPVGATLFEAKYDIAKNDSVSKFINDSSGASAYSINLLCWRDYEDLKKAAEKAPILQPKADCIYDKDKDGKYEILYKDAVFASGSAYSVTYVYTDVKLDGSDNKLPISVKPSSTDGLMPEKIGIYYLGPSGEKIDDNGRVITNEISFEWRYLTLPILNNDTPSRLRKFTINLDDNGKGQKLGKNGEKIIEVSAIYPDGSADIKFNDFYNIGNQALVDYKEAAEIARQQEKTLRDSIADKSILKKIKR